MKPLIVQWGWVQGQQQQVNPLAVGQTRKKLDLSLEKNFLGAYLCSAKVHIKMKLQQLFCTGSELL